MIETSHGLTSRLIMDGLFEKAIEGLRSKKIPEPQKDSICSIDEITVNEGKVEKIESGDRYQLNAKAGYDYIINEDLIKCAYSESSSVYEMLEGRAVSTAHSLVYVTKTKYVPVSYVSLKYITHSDSIAKQMGQSAILSDHVSHDTAIAVARDKMSFLDKYCTPNSLLYIDGPLIAGDDYTTFLKQIDKFCDRNIIPVFFISKSNSCMVVDNVNSLSSKYNSDSHWANSILDSGQRTAFYSYTDLHNSRNSKAFCYIKIKDNARIVRVELPLIIYRSSGINLEGIMNSVYYMLLAQGSFTKPQVRLIAVARMYSNETLKLIDIEREVRKSKLQTIFDQFNGSDN